MTSNSRREGQVDSSNTLAKPQKVRKNKYGDPDTFNNSLAEVRKRLVMKPYKLQFVQAITADDNR